MSIYLWPWGMQKYLTCDTKDIIRIRKKIDKLDFNKIKNVCSSKHTDKRMRRLATA